MTNSAILSKAKQGLGQPYDFPAFPGGIAAGFTQAGWVQLPTRALWVQRHDKPKHLARLGIPLESCPGPGRALFGDKTMEKIRPCPFCGKEPKIIEGKRYVLIECKGTNEDMIHSITTVWFYKEYKREAIKAWNKRF